MSNVYDTDTGSNAQWVTTWLGPSLGWSLLPVVPELYITTAAPLIVPPFASRLLLMTGPIGPITLPSVSSWMEAQGPDGLVQNISGFDRSIWVKDFAYGAGFGPIVIEAAGTDTIDGQATFQIVEAGQLIRLYPLTDLSGWYVG